MTGIGNCGASEHSPLWLVCKHQVAEDKPCADRPPTEAVFHSFGSAAALTRYCASLTRLELERAGVLSYRQR